MLTVSNFHYIREDFSAPFPSIFGLSPKSFKHQLVRLSDFGKFISPKELLLKNDEILNSKENYLLITFDDGLKEQFELAKPILDDLNIQALCFVNSINFIKKEVSLVHKIHLLRSKISSSELLNNLKNSPFKSNFILSDYEKKKAVKHYNFDDVSTAYLKYSLNFRLSPNELSKAIDGFFYNLFDTNKIVDELYMSENQLKFLANHNQLGSHTHSHLALGLLDEKTIQFELERTKEYFERITQTNVEIVSYPYGSDEACAKLVPELAKEIKYKLGFTMKRGINFSTENKLLLKRFDCNETPVVKMKKYF